MAKPLTLEEKARRSPKVEGLTPLQQQQRQVEIDAALKPAFGKHKPK